MFQQAVFEHWLQHNCISLSHIITSVTHAFVYFPTLTSTGILTSSPEHTSQVDGRSDGRRRRQRPLRRGGAGPGSAGRQQRGEGEGEEPLRRLKSSGSAKREFICDRCGPKARLAIRNFSTRFGSFFPKNSIVSFKFFEFFLENLEQCYIHWQKEKEERKLTSGKYVDFPEFRTAFREYLGDKPEVCRIEI